MKISQHQLRFYCAYVLPMLLYGSIKWTTLFLKSFRPSSTHVYIMPLGYSDLIHTRTEKYVTYKWVTGKCIDERRKWKYTGYTLRKSFNFIAGYTMDWNPLSHYPRMTNEYFALEICGAEQWRTHCQDPIAMFVRVSFNMLAAKSPGPNLWIDESNLSEPTKLPKE